jgi:hypothetical protein
VGLGVRALLRKCKVFIGKSNYRHGLHLIKAHTSPLSSTSPHTQCRGQRTHSASTLNFKSAINHSTMKYSTVCAAFFAAVVAASDVKQLKTDNFKSFIEENDLVLAECKSPLA